MKLKKADRFAYVLILPFFAGFFLFTLYPVLNTLLTSFTDESLASFDAPLMVGLDNYWAEITSELFWKSFANTWII